MAQSAHVTYNNNGLTFKEYEHLEDLYKCEIK